MPAAPNRGFWNLTALSSSVLSRTLYGYDGASRLLTVNDGNNNTATYSYLANSPLVSQITYQHSGTTRMTTTKQYDYLNRLTQISSAPSKAYTLPLTYNYTYNPANQRTKDTLADGSYWVYGYDSLGQVTNGCKYFANGTLVPGQQFDYAFDTIGNRTNTQSGGDTNGANLRLANYYANSLNQVTNRDVPPYVDIMGASILTNTVTVNGQTASRIQEYYRAQIPANNASTALWTNVTVTGGQTVSGNVYVPKEPELFKYDADGNLTNDGRWYYSWDAENRLIGMTNYTGVGPAYNLAFTYDAKGRRIQKVVTTNEVAFTTNSFLYDGWNLVAALSQISVLQFTFMWGNDLSGSQQGAGGVGGLLAVCYHGTATTNAFVAYDGNGNVSTLIIAADGTLAANYDYGPFGEVIRATGPMSKANPIRFSTEFQDDESDLLYYGFRYYRPSSGAWLTRDKMDDLGTFVILGVEPVITEIMNVGDSELNIYALAKNDLVDAIDFRGLYEISDGPRIYKFDPGYWGTIDLKPTLTMRGDCQPGPSINGAYLQVTGQTSDEWGFRLGPAGFAIKYSVSFSNPILVSSIRQGNVLINTYSVVSTTTTQKTFVLHTTVTTHTYRAITFTLKCAACAAKKR